MCRCLLARLWQPWLDQLTQSTELRRYQISKVNFAKWGIRLAEMRAENWPKAREGAPVPEETWYRATSVNAPPSIVFRWICQLRAAPYSYDWIDNFGRQSPRQLIDGLERLRIGLKVMTIFRIHDFSTDHYLTIVLWPPRSILCSALRITYLCLPLGEKRTRLLVRVQIGYPKHPFRSLIRLLLPPGDLVMMRKQLLTLKCLSERPSEEASWTLGQ